jgi:hypothetical protein
MLDNAREDQLSNIISGKIFESQRSTLSAARNYLAGSFETSTKIERDFARFSIIKEAQKAALKKFARSYKCLISLHQLPCTFLSEGRELQVFLEESGSTDLDALANFMQHNGFHNVRGFDYYSKHYGLCIEDLHDENVLTRSGVFFFIDTVFLIDLKS